jgi:hypothetical protein
VDKLERSHKRAALLIEVLVEDIDKLARNVRQMKALSLPQKCKIGFGISELPLAVSSTVA